MSLIRLKLEDRKKVKKFFKDETARSADCPMCWISA
jgi:hypothetical protein